MSPKSNHEGKIIPTTSNTFRRGRTIKCGSKRKNLPHDVHVAAALEPASSSEDDDLASSSDEEDVSLHRQGDIDGEDDGDDVDESSDEEVEAARNVATFDDLPTDDSCSVSSSSSFDDVSGGEREDGEERSPEELPRITAKRQAMKEAKEKFRTFVANVPQLRKKKAVAPRKKSNREESDGSSAEEAGNDNSDDDAAAAQARPKRSKHRPTEVSSRRGDFFRREGGLLRVGNSGVSLEAKAIYKPRDPRQVTLTGRLDQDVFERRYGFLEEMVDEEIATLRERILARETTGSKGNRRRRKTGVSADPDELAKDRDQLQRLQEGRRERERDRKTRGAKRAVKKKMVQDIVDGKLRGPYYMKRREKREAEMAAKFEALQKEGGNKAVDQALTKKRKKAQMKDRRHMPFSRNDTV